MSSNRPAVAKAKTAPSAEVHQLPPLHEEPLTPQETKRLNFLGYKADDIASFSPEEARWRLTNKKAKPGSKAYLKTATNPLTGTPGVPLPASLSNEEIERRNAGKDRAHIITDEWEGKREEAGGALFDQVDRPYREANPDKSFRWLHEDIVKRLGDGGFTPVKGPSAAGRVECGGHYLGWKPRAVENEERKEQEERNNAPFGAMGNPFKDVDPRVGGFGQTVMQRGEELPRNIA